MAPVRLVDRHSDRVPNAAAELDETGVEGGHHPDLGDVHARRAAAARGRQQRDETQADATAPNTSLPPSVPACRCPHRGQATADEARLDPELRRFLPHTYDMKAIADYETGPGAVIPPEQVETAIETAARFVECIAELLA